MKQLRIDRLLTLYLFYYAMAVLRRPSEWHIPILMYHSISEDNVSNRMHPYYQTNTSPAIFEAHMEYLYKNDYSILDIREVEKLHGNSSRDKAKYAIITFDDGFKDFYTEAFPVLQRYSFTATVFLPTAFISEKRDRFKNMECMIWNEVRDLTRQGITFGSHTVNHPQLRSLAKKDIEYEIVHSKDVIETNLGCSVELFSYPFAYPEDSDFQEYFRCLLEKCGYKSGVSTRIGTTDSNDNIFAMRRIPVNSCDDISLFRAKLEGGYDWMYSVQYLSKKMKMNRN